MRKAGTAHCDGTVYGYHPCGHPAVFAVWHGNEHEKAKGACRHHLARLTEELLEGAEPRYVKVTPIGRDER